MTLCVVVRTFYPIATQLFGAIQCNIGAINKGVQILIFAILGDAYADGNMDFFFLI